MYIYLPLNMGDFPAIEHVSFRGEEVLGTSEISRLLGGIRGLLINGSCDARSPLLPGMPGLQKNPPDVRTVRVNLDVSCGPSAAARPHRIHLYT